MNRYCFVAITFLLAGFLLAHPGWAAQTAEAAPKTLEDEIRYINLTASVEVFRPGGVTIEDAVQLLRQRTVFPICFESMEYDRDTDGLTLGEVLNSFHALKTRSGLTAEDGAHLKMYEEMAVTQSTATLVGIKEKTFTLVQDKMTVRTFLNRVTQLDSAYKWTNEGTGTAPLIVIQPRTRSVLDWPIPRICGTPQEASSKILYGPQGKLSAFFAVHNITRVEMDMRPARPGDKRESDLPNVPLDLCQDQLTAYDVLNRTVKAAGTSLSWSLSGIKGLRWLSFQQSGRLVESEMRYPVPT